MSPIYAFSIVDCFLFFFLIFILPDFIYLFIHDVHDVKSLIFDNNIVTLSEI